MFDTRSMVDIELRLYESESHLTSFTFDYEKLRIRYNA